MVLIYLFFVSLIVAIVAIRFFVRPERDGLYFMSGVGVLAYACAKAFGTLLNAETPSETLAGLLLAAIPLMIWGLPLITKLPWTDGIMRMDG
ncbi:MAG: hypothetical protein P4L67_02155 [Candidatus Pacebacteria bacterium]|nr:hypothetical protein [Candidatus Paceibacterota bacterium]